MISHLIEYLATNRLAGNHASRHCVKSFLFKEHLIFLKDVWGACFKVYLNENEYDQPWQLLLIVFDTVSSSVQGRRKWGSGGAARPSASSPLSFAGSFQGPCSSWSGLFWRVFWFTVHTLWLAPGREPLDVRSMGPLVAGPVSALPLLNLPLLLKSLQKVLADLEGHGPWAYPDMDMEDWRQQKAMTRDVWPSLCAGLLRGAKCLKIFTSKKCKWND